ncbi:hypothetical protein ACP70R_011195 [Stipagrostis hirtigluma subsp. patula]
MDVQLSNHEPTQLRPCAGGPDRDDDKEEDDARRFILQVKETVERCLAQGMDKAQMFRVIREEGLPSSIAFAVYKQLRDQNHAFFKEYYSMIDLKEQRERFNHLIQAYRAGGSNVNAVAAGVRVPETATTSTSMELDIPVHNGWPDQQAVQGWLDHTAHLAIARGVGGGDDQLAGAARPQQALRLPAGQQLRYHQQPVADGGVQEVAWPQQAAQLPAIQQLHYQEQPGAIGVIQDQKVAWQQQTVQSPAVQQLHTHEQLMTADGGFHAVPLASAAGLSDGAMMACWPPSLSSHGGHGHLWQGQEADPRQQLWHGSGDDPLRSWQEFISGPGKLLSSTTLPEDDPVVNQSFHINPPFQEQPR